MKLKEKLAHAHAQAELEKRPMQPFEDYYKTTRAYEAGFEKARELAGNKLYSSEFYSRADTPEVLRTICNKVGEEEVE